MIKHVLILSKSWASDTTDGVAIRLIVVVRVPIVLIDVPGILRIVTVGSTRPEIVSCKDLSLLISTQF